MGSVVSSCVRTPRPVAITGQPAHVHLTRPIGLTGLEHVALLANIGLLLFYRPGQWVSQPEFEDRWRRAVGGPIDLHAQGYESMDELFSHLQHALLILVEDRGGVKYLLPVRQFWFQFARLADHALFYSPQEPSWPTYAYYDGSSERESTPSASRPPSYCSRRSVDGESSAHL